MESAHNAGFTLIELLIAVSIFAFLLMVAGPQYADFMGNMQIRNGGENTLNGVRRAQAEAIRNNSQAQFVLDPTPCTGGWQVLRLNDETAAFDAVESYLFSDGACKVTASAAAFRSHHCDLQWHGQDRCQPRRQRDAALGGNNQHQCQCAAQAAGPSQPADPRRHQALRSGPGRRQRRSARVPCDMSRRTTVQARALSSPRAQTGAYLLEALIAILIFSFGVLGIVGLQAQALRFTNDSEYRAEAVYLANSLISQMWVDSYNTIPANYASPSGAKFLTFKTNVSNSFKAAMVADPIVLVDPPAPMPQAPTKTSRVVQVQIFWRLPGETIQHNYTTTGVVGMN